MRAPIDQRARRFDHAPLFAIAAGVVLSLAIALPAFADPTTPTSRFGGVYLTSSGKGF